MPTILRQHRPRVARRAQRQQQHERNGANQANGLFCSKTTFLSLATIVAAGIVVEAWTLHPFLHQRQRGVLPPQGKLQHQQLQLQLPTQLTAHKHQGPPLDDTQTPFYPKPRIVDKNAVAGDLTGGRPGAIIETEEQLEIKERMLQELEDGTRVYKKTEDLDISEYGESLDDEDGYDTDDPEAIDITTWGSWTIQDLKAKFVYDWDPNDPTQKDPNMVELEGHLLVQETDKDEDGVEVGYDPIFGPSNPVDKRTILGSIDSYMIDDATRNDDMLTPQFAPGDLEKDFNAEVVQFRKSLNLLETYVDPFLSADLPIPSHVAMWHGYPEQVFYEPKNFTNNRFTKPEDKTDFDSLTPYRARQRAVELARAKNAEWLPDGVSQEYHAKKRKPYEEYGTDLGTLRSSVDTIDPELIEQMKPALSIFGACVELLSVWTDEETGNIVVRFSYHGLMKNKYGMSCWMKSLLQEECGLPVTGVVFETGFRRRDPAYDGGGYWYGPSN